MAPSESHGGGARPQPGDAAADPLAVVARETAAPARDNSAKPWVSSSAAAGSQLPVTAAVVSAPQAPPAKRGYAETAGGLEPAAPPVRAEEGGGGGGGGPKRPRAAEVVVGGGVAAVAAAAAADRGNGLGGGQVTTGSSSSSSSSSNNMGSSDHAAVANKSTTILAGSSPRAGARGDDVDAASTVSGATGSFSGAPGSSQKPFTPTTEEIRRMLIDRVVPILEPDAIEPAPAPADLDKTDVDTLVSIVNNCNEQHSNLVETLQRGKALRALEKRGDVIGVKRRRFAAGPMREKIVVEYWTGGARGKGQRAEKEIKIPVFRVTRAKSVLEKIDRVLLDHGIHEAEALKLAARVDLTTFGKVLRSINCKKPSHYFVHRDFVTVVQTVYEMTNTRDSSPSSDGRLAAAGTTANPSVATGSGMMPLSGPLSGALPPFGMPGVAAGDAGAHGQQDCPLTAAVAAPRDSVPPLPVARGSPVGSPVHSLAWSTPQVVSDAQQTSGKQT
jgi:hypothetical protein